MPIITKTSSTAAKVSPVSMDRTTAQIRAPADTTGQSENKIEIRTWLTRPGETQILYNGDRMWARVTLTLTSAGPVSVGEQSSLSPLLSGRGQLLQTNVPVTFNIAKGNRLRILSETVNRVNYTIEAYPFLETITGVLSALAGIGGRTISAALAKVSGKAG